MNKYIEKVGLGIKDSLLTSLNDQNNQFPIIPFKTLAMIQQANGEKLVLLALFECLKENEVVSEPYEAFSLRMLVIIEDKIYIKKTLKDEIFIVHLSVNVKRHYVVLLKNVQTNSKDDFQKKVFDLLGEDMVVCEQQSIC